MFNFLSPWRSPNLPFIIIIVRSRVATFLPQLQKANEALSFADPKDYCIEKENLIEDQTLISTDSSPSSLEEEEEEDKEYHNELVVNCASHIEMSLSVGKIPEILDSDSSDHDRDSDSD